MAAMAALDGCVQINFNDLTQLVGETLRGQQKILLDLVHLASNVNSGSQEIQSITFDLDFSALSTIVSGVRATLPSRPSRPSSAPCCLPSLGTPSSPEKIPRSALQPFRSELTPLPLRSEYKVEGSSALMKKIAELEEQGAKVETLQGDIAQLRTDFTSLQEATQSSFNSGTTDSLGQYSLPTESPPVSATPVPAAAPTGVSLPAQQNLDLSDELTVKMFAANLPSIMACMAADKQNSSSSSSGVGSVQPAQPPIAEITHAAPALVDNGAESVCILEPLPLPECPIVEWLYFQLPSETVADLKKKTEEAYAALPKNYGAREIQLLMHKAKREARVAVEAQAAAGKIGNMNTGLAENLSPGADHDVDALAPAPTPKECRNHDSCIYETLEMPDEACSAAHLPANQVPNVSGKGDAVEDADEAVATPGNAPKTTLVSLFTDISWKLVEKLSLGIIGGSGSCAAPKDTPVESSSSPSKGWDDLLVETLTMSLSITSFFLPFLDS